MQDFRTELAQFYQDRRQGLYSLALILTGCPSLAEDAIQDAFARLCSRTGRPDGQLAAYVFAAVRNAAIDLRRRQQHQQNVARSLFVSIPPPGSDRQPREDDPVAEQLQRLIDDLPEPDRELLVLKIHGSLTFAELSDVLRLSASTIATRYRRLLARLESRLRSHHEQP